MKITNITINNLISDAKTSLESGAYFSALSLAFALVSECAELDYPPVNNNMYKGIFINPKEIRYLILNDLTMTDRVNDCMI